MKQGSAVKSNCPGANPGTLAGRIAALNWPEIATALHADGFARVPRLLDHVECDELIASYPHPAHFRSKVVMGSYGFGSGEYQYFSSPLPTTVATLRRDLYPLLVEVANSWQRSMRLDVLFPPTLAEFTARCHAAGQRRPTPLLLKYSTGDFNRLHQDLYGQHAFPIQLTVLLSEPTSDFHGGQFVLTEQRARAQSRVQVVPLERGDGVLFAVNDRPVQSARGIARARVRHGVSTVTVGERYTLGVIFHDAE